MQINIIIVNDMCQLDTTGAFEVLVRIPGWTVDLVAASMEPVRTDRGLTILPTQTRESAKPSDILVVPGGPGIDNAMLDDGCRTAYGPPRRRALASARSARAVRCHAIGRAPDGGWQILYFRRRHLRN
jgi:hypothetical protein